MCGRRGSNPRLRRGAPTCCLVDPHPQGGVLRSLAVERRPREPRPANRAVRGSMAAVHGRPGGTLTPVSRFAAARLDPRPPGVALPGRGSNPRLPGNSRTSCRSTTWHGCTATGSRTPASGLRARRLVHLDHRGMRGSGGTRTHKGSHPYLFSGQPPHLAGSLPGAEGAGLAPARAGGPYPRSRRAPHLAGSLPRWGPRWASHPRPRPYRGRALSG